MLVRLISEVLFLEINTTIGKRWKQNLVSEVSKLKNNRCICHTTGTV